MSYNINNKLIDEKIIKNIIIKGSNKAIEDVNINDIWVYQKAFIQKSFLVDNQEDTEQYSSYYNNTIKKLEIPETHLESNEWLEFAGDSILSGIIGEYISIRYGLKGKKEGFLTKLKTKLVRTDMFAKFAILLGLREYLLISSKLDESTKYGPDKGRNTPRILEDLFEAFMGAIIVDNKDNTIEGYRICKTIVIHLLETTVDFNDLISNNDNYKDSLLRYFQYNTWNFPTYIEIYHKGPQHHRIYTIGIFLTKKQIESMKDIDKKESIIENLKQYQNTIKGILSNEEEGLKTLNSYLDNDYYIIGMDRGKSKKEAEQKCSKKALTLLKVSWNY